MLAFGRRRNAFRTWVAAVALVGVTGVTFAPTDCHARSNAREKGSSYIKISSEAELPVSRALSLDIGRALIVDLPVDAKDTIVSDPKTVDVTPFAARRLLFVPKEVGVSNVFVLGRDGNRILTLDITVGKDLSELTNTVHSVLPGAKISARQSGTGIVLTGTVASPADAGRAAEIAGTFLGNNTKVVNLITMGQKEQVLLKVTVAELQRDAIRRMGINMPEALLKAGSFTFTKVMANNFPVSAAAAAASTFAGAGQVPFVSAGSVLQSTAKWNGNSVTTMLETLERVGLSRTLAEPTLVAISGEAAKFHAGGELPVPVAQENNTITVSWKPFGIGVSFTPYVQSEGRISLKVAAEVSELSSQGAVATNGISIPAIQTRKAETVVEMSSGSALAMAGLLSDQTRQNTDGIPELKNLPVLGALFRSKDFRSSQSELVIMVTPYVVRPTEKSDLSRPDEGMLHPSPLRALFDGHLHRVYSHLPAETLRGDHGFIVEHPRSSVKD